MVSDLQFKSYGCSKFCQIQISNKSCAKFMKCCHNQAGKGPRKLQGPGPGKREARQVTFSPQKWLNMHERQTLLVNNNAR